MPFFECDSFFSLFSLNKDLLSIDISTSMLWYNFLSYGESEIDENEQTTEIVEDSL